MMIVIIVMGFIIISLILFGAVMGIQLINTYFSMLDEDFGT